MSALRARRAGERSYGLVGHQPHAALRIEGQTIATERAVSESGMRLDEASPQAGSTGVPRRTSLEASGAPSLAGVANPGFAQAAPSLDRLRSLNRHLRKLRLHPVLARRLVRRHATRAADRLEFMLVEDSQFPV